MTKEQLDYLVKLYTQHINKKGVDFYVKQDEGYKFDFVNNFQSHFDIESTDFHGMMSKSLLNNNLTSGVYFFSKKNAASFYRTRRKSC